MANQSVYPYGTNGELPSSIGLINDTTTGGADKALSAQQGVVLRETIGEDFFQRSESVDLSILVQRPCSLGTNKWYRSPATTGAQAHLALPVLPGETYLVHVKSVAGDTTTGGSGYAFVTNAYAQTNPANNNSIPFAGTQTSRYTTEVYDQPVERTAPEDAAYLVLTAVDGAGQTIVWEIRKVCATTESAAVRVNDLEHDVLNLQKINISSFEIHPFSLANASVGWWWEPATKVQKHIAIPVSAGEKYVLTADTTDDNVFIGFLTSSYTPPTTYGANIPYVVGTDRIGRDPEDDSVVTIPPGTSYLILCVTSGYETFVKWNVYQVLQTGMVSKDVADLMADKETAHPIRVAGWNIGHFALGASYDTIITGQTYEAEKTRWRSALNNIAPDILLMCEYNKNFVNASGNDPAITARDAVFCESLLKNAYEGTRPSGTSYMMTAMYANRVIENVHQVVYEHTVQAGRYYQVGEMYLFGKKVKVVSTHLDFNQGEYGATYRAEQIQALITAFQNDPYVILYADFNVNSSDEFDQFLTAGYNMANHDYLGDVYTYPADDPQYPIDNILVKGFSVKNIQVYEDNDKLLSDHLCIFADITMILP